MDKEELLEMVKSAFLRTAKIASRGCWGYTKGYASASGASWLAFGEDVFDRNGFSKDWQIGFDEGFEFIDTKHWWDLWEATNGSVSHLPVARPFGGDEFNRGFQLGMWVSDQVFNHWPESPDIYSVPDLRKTKFAKEDTHA